MKINNRAFSLVELSIVVLIIGVLIAAVGQGVELYKDSKLTAARMLTQSSRVTSMKGLVLWFESTMENSFSVSEAVDTVAISTWFDSTPRDKNNATQSTAANKPTYLREGINTLPTVNFAPTTVAGVTTGQYLDLTSPNVAVGASGLTTFFVASGLGPTAFRAEGAMVLGLGVGGTKCARIFSTDAWHGSWAPTSAPAIISNTPVICSAKYDGSNIQGWTNGGSQDTANAATGPIGASGIPRIGGSPLGAEYFTGNIGEIIIFDRALTTKEMDTVETYLSKKWGIKLN